MMSEASSSGGRVQGALVILAGLLPMVLLLWIEGIPSVQPKLLVTHLLAYLTVVLLPYSIISEVGNRLSSQRDGMRENERREDEGREKGRFHGGALIGVLERSFIFVLFLMTATHLLPLKDALGSLALIIAAKALFRFNERTTEAEWYIIGTFLSITSGVALSWFTLHVIWGSLGC